MSLEYAISESSKHEFFSGQNVLPNNTATLHSNVTGQTSW